MSDTNTDEKFCPSCNRWRSPLDFDKGARTTDGLYLICRECQGRINREGVPSRFLRQKVLIPN